MCRRTVRVLRALDWFHRLDFADLNSAPDLPVAIPDALAGMPMRTLDGRVLIGFPAVRRALARTPLGLPVALILFVPGISSLADRLYRVIARSRRRSCSPPAQLPPNPSRPILPS
jgi:predicted DCC family thiol-disulfide oxidoreductase YuxK